MFFSRQMNETHNICLNLIIYVYYIYEYEYEYLYNYLLLYFHILIENFYDCNSQNFILNFYCKKIMYEMKYILDSYISNHDDIQKIRFFCDAFEALCEAWLKRE